MQRIDRHDRETFIAALLKAVPTATRDHALKLLRWGATYGRLAEARCNADYPADNGTGGVMCNVAGCESIWRGRFTFSKSHNVKICPSCRAERIIRETCASLGHADTFSVDGAGGYFVAPPMVHPDFQGDPRGHTVRLQIAGAPLDAYERPALAVPTS